MLLKALSVNTVVMEGNVPTKAWNNNPSSALLQIPVQTFCRVFDSHSRCALTISQMGTLIQGAFIVRFKCIVWVLATFANLA